MERLGEFFEVVPRDFLGLLAEGGEVGKLRLGKTALHCANDKVSAHCHGLTATSVSNDNSPTLLARMERKEDFSRDVVIDVHAFVGCAFAI